MTEQRGLLFSFQQLQISLPREVVSKLLILLQLTQLRLKPYKLLLWNWHSAGSRGYVGGQGKVIGSFLQAVLAKTVVEGDESSGYIISGILSVSDEQLILFFFSPILLIESFKSDTVLFMYSALFFLSPPILSFMKMNATVNERLGGF